MQVDTIHSTATDTSHLEPNSSKPSKTITNDYVAERLVRLVSVGLKEATMDSPSFRASMNYTHVAIIQCSQQIEKSITILQNYAKKWSTFIDATNEVQSVFTQYINTTQFMSSEITKPCIDLFLEGQKTINEGALSLLDIKDISFSSMRNIIEVDIPQYVELRRNFERLQSKYDIISANYMQLPKHYDPAKTRDDALQLFEIRKQYIHISMSFWIAIKQLEMKLCKVSTDTVKLFWKSFDKKNTTYGAKLSDAIGLSEIVNSIKQLNMCADLQQESSKLLIEDLNKVRMNSEEGAYKIYNPSPNIKDFDSAIISNANLLLDSDNQLLEKHGWVFIKSSKLTGKGDVWIKRWLFVKNEVFGFLSISTDGQYVQETDKIGLLLVDIKHWPSEDRKFCFKISGAEINLTIQVETSNELRSWLTVFDNAKKVLATENRETAMKRYPPPLKILKLEPVVAVDLKLVDVLKPEPQVEKTTKLIEIQLSNLSLNLAIDTPLRTSITNQIAMSHLYLSSSTVPSAITANIWGYVNWGLYFVLDDVNKSVISKNNKSLLPTAIINLRYPKYYPESLRLADAELRSIFEAYVVDDELTLLKFNASWSPNSDQRLFCTVYVTTKSYYVYSHTSGLISIVPIPLTSFLNSDVFESSCGLTLMKIYFVSGLLMKLQLYTSDPNIIKSKFNYILSNMKSQDPDDFEMQILHLNSIEKTYHEMKQNKKLNLITNGVRSEEYRDLDKINGVQIDVPSKANQIDLNPSLAESSGNNKINYASEMHLVSMQSFNAPSKAVFHMLFGDESSLTQCTLPLSSSLFRNDHTTHSLWRCDLHQQLTRVVWDSAFKIPCSKQKIEAMNNNKYYNVLQETPFLRFIFGINRKIAMRFVIYSLDSKTSKLMVYYSIGEGSNMLNWFSRKIIHQIMLFRSEALEAKLSKAIKELKDEPKKIGKAIKMYGPITKYESDEPTKEEEMFQRFVNFIPLQVFLSFYYEMINQEIERFFISILQIIKKLVSTTISFVSTYVLFLSILGLSLLLNLFLIGKSTGSFWRERNITKQMAGLIGDKHVIERSISMKEINQLIYPDTANLSAYPQGSDCFWQFLRHEELLDVAKFSRLEKGKTDIESDHVEMLTAGRELALSKKLFGLRIERNEVLTKLNLLNYLERELILKDWKNWISSEIANCEKIQVLYPEYFKQIENYCEEVKTEMLHLYSDLL